MLLRHPNFFDEEKLAPILDRNNAFLQEDNVERSIERTAHWPELIKKSISGSKEKINYFKVLEIGPTASERIIGHDAERTYTNPSRRKLLSKLLSCYENTFKDYHQGLSLTCGFLLLTLSEQDVANIVAVLASHPKFIPDYWRAEAIAGARDAYVWEFLLGLHFPEIAEYLRKKSVYPETFCQKWFIALGINVLPFAAQYSFFEFFLEQGYLYLLKFGLTLVSTFKDHILQSPDYEIFKILRYDKELNKKSITDDLMMDVVQRAANFQLAKFDITSVRDKVFKEKLQARLERARKLAEEKDESEEILSSSSEEGSNSGEDSESGAECALCKENAPDMWCLSCKIMICERCHEGKSKTHKKTHKVDENWTKYDK